MIKIKYIILVFSTFLFTCKASHKPRTIVTAKIKEFKRDSTSIRAIQVVDTNTLYYAGSNGDIGFTNDGGKTWKTKIINYQDSIKPHFRSIAKSGSNIFVLSIGNPALLYKISKNKTTLVYKEEHKNVFYDSMKFFEDGKHGIAVGDPIENYPTIITTSNSGNTWTRIPTQKLPKFEKGEAFFAASNTNIKIINNTVWIVSGGKKARILKSTNKGKTWTITNTPFIQGKGSQGIYSVDFATKNRGIIVGGDYANPTDNCHNKAITKNGGKTWEIVADNQNPTYKSCVQYVPNTDGKEIFAIGKTGISFSNDKGLHWKNISNESFYTIQFINKHTAWLAGNQKIGKLILTYSKK